MARVSDLLIAVVLIAVTLPLMVIVALAIKLDSPGPVLLKREQWGPQGHKFQLFNFRTESHALQGSSRLRSSAARHSNRRVSLLDADRQPAAAHQCAVRRPDNRRHRKAPP